MHAGKLGQVTNFTTVGGTAKHCIDKCMVLFCYCSLGGDTAMLDRLHARLCHAFLLLLTTPGSGRCVGKMISYTCLSVFLFVHAVKGKMA